MGKLWHTEHFLTPPHMCQGYKKKAKQHTTKLTHYCVITHTHNLTFLDSGYVCVCVFVVLILENSSALRAGS